MIMMIAFNSLIRQKEGAQMEEEEEAGAKKGRTDKNSDPRRGRSHWSNLVRDIGYEEQEKTWTEVWGSTLLEGQRELGIGPILSR